MIHIFPLSFKHIPHTADNTYVLLTRVQTLSWPAKWCTLIPKPTKLQLLDPNKTKDILLLLLYLTVLRNGTES